MVVKVGQLAPTFVCDAYQSGKFTKVSLADYRGKWVVLFFYPLDFTFVCPTELTGFGKALPEFTKLNAVVFGVSTDSVHSHKAWFSKDLPEVTYPILADTNHQLSRSYGVLLEDQGIALRGTFVISPDGILEYMVISSLNVGRSVQETLRVLQALQSGGLCPIEWKPGQPTL